MIRSMTGYGSTERVEGDVRYRLEIRSLNNRYFKASIRLPEHLHFVEADIDKLLRARLSRGSVTFMLRIRDESADAAVPVNQAALRSYMDQLTAAATDVEVTATVDLAALASLPGVCQSQDLDEETRKRYGETVTQLANEALDALIEMRRREGEALRQDLLGHCDALTTNLAAITELAPTVVEEYRVRLQDRVNTLLNKAELTLQEDALVREVALFADRCDVSEEIARFTSHLDQFRQVCDSPEPAGRKLDFLAQELLREANTIGSKSNHATITRHVVDMKSLVDRLKEQVQNVE